ncbi:MAG: N-acetyltransferase [Fusobacterium sp.]|nr:N-acetyltransferase [Fusobacterium sp.]
MEIIHYEGQGFYIHDANKDILAQLEYKRVNNILTADHTEVSESLKGQGIAGKLFNELVKYARENNYKINPVCTYVQKKLEKPDYDDLKI